MSANPDARPQSRRSILTAALAGTAPGATMAGHVALAATALPDPIFAAIAAERRAWRAYEDASDAYSKADEALMATGLDRLPRVLIGEWHAMVRRDASGELVPVPPSERVVDPIYATTHAHIDQDCDNDARRPGGDPDEAEVRRRRLHVELDADIAAVAAAKAPVDEAERLSDETHATWKAQADALIAVAPTTIPGLLTLLDRYVEHTDDTRISQDDDGLRPLLSHVRRLLGEVRV